jgi:hypothetical protein
MVEGPYNEHFLLLQKAFAGSLLKHLNGFAGEFFLYQK